MNRDLQTIDNPQLHPTLVKEKGDPVPEFPIIPDTIVQIQEITAHRHVRAAEAVTLTAHQADLELRRHHRERLPREADPCHRELPLRADPAVAAVEEGNQKTEI